MTTVRTKNNHSIISSNPSMYHFTVKEEPLTWERPDLDGDPVIQNTQMMYFQQKVMMYLRGEIRSKYNNINLPLTDPITLDIGIKSRKELKDMSLQHVLKAIMDACNKNIIDDDRLIENVRIDYTKDNSAQRGLVQDQVYIEIDDLKSNRNVAATFGADIVEKQVAVPFNVGGQLLFSQNCMKHQNVLCQEIRQLHSQLPAAAKRTDDVECHVLFKVSNLHKDADNTMLMYLPVLQNELLHGNEQVYAINLYKRNATNGDSFAAISVVSK